MATTRGGLTDLYQQAATGRLSRRAFIRGATALGVATPVLLNALINGSTAAGARSATPAAAGATPAGAPSGGTAGQRRGAGGDLILAHWQTPGQLATHTASGTVDAMAAGLVLEPLLHFSPDGRLIPNLVKEIPSWQNGLLAADNRTVTYDLLPGVTWSDGTPFTAHDVVFTWQWIMNPQNRAVDVEYYRPIEEVAALSDTRLRISFTSPQPAWYLPFSSSLWGTIYPAHILSAADADYNAFRWHPIGTGPYVVNTFIAHQGATFLANPKYREPNKPSFAKITLAAAADATAAAKAVLQTGNADFAPNVQLAPDVLTDLERGGNGTVVAAPGATVEQILLNFSDPNQVVNGQRSYWKQPNPILGEKAVRQALNLAIDRNAVAKLYGPDQPATANILTGIGALTSSRTSWAFNPAKASQMLDAAGWRTEGGGRRKNGKPLLLRFATSNNATLFQIQQIVKRGFAAIGVETELLQIDSNIFFTVPLSSNTYNYSAFPGDLEMLANSPFTPFPLDYLSTWYAGAGGQNIAQRANDWTGANYARYHNPAYDKFYEAAQQEIDPAKSAALFIQMNDLLIDDAAVIPLVQRAADVMAVSAKLNPGNIAAGPFETDYWNIANWTAAGR